MADSFELFEAADAIGGICIAATPIPMTSSTMAQQAADAFVEAMGAATLPRFAHPHGLLARVGALRSLLAELPEANSDADRLTIAMLSGRQDLILDAASQVFHVLDGTNTDLVFSGGRAYISGERPLALIDPSEAGVNLARLLTDLDDAGSRDLASLLGYWGAIDGREGTTVGAPDVLAMPFWSPSFCATVIRAAEIVGAWRMADETAPGEETLQLEEISLSLFDHLKADIDLRIHPRLQEQWPDAVGATMTGAAVVRSSNLVTAYSARDAYLLGSIRLNEGYRGGALLLPDHDWADSSIGVGELAAWRPGVDLPSSTSTSPVRAGVKYRLAVWWSVAR
jgi:hypothetical protein